MTTHARAETRRRRTPVQNAALAVGAVFLLVGLLGFIPGVTTNYGDLAAAGPDSDALLLGLFQVSILHNMVHLLYGAAGVALARATVAARQYLLWGGVVYLVLWLYGLVVAEDSPANFVPMNDADDWLHLVLGAAMVVLALTLGRRSDHDATLDAGRPTTDR